MFNKKVIDLIVNAIERTVDDPWGSLLPLYKLCPCVFIISDVCVVGYVLGSFGSECYV